MVGYTLRQERERQNLSISDVEEGTSIRAIYIEAIEAGEYDKLPGNVYTKGFIKSYAKFLDMDVDALVKEFLADIAELTPPESVTTEAAAQVTESKGEVKPVQSEKKLFGYSIQTEDRSPSNALIVAAVVLVAVLAGGIWAFMSGSDSDVAKVDTPQVQEEQVATSEPPPADNPTPVANANPAPPPSDNVAIQARFNDRCWVLVTIDGAVVQEGVIEGGQTLSWEGKDNISFRLGNAGAVEFFQNGQSLGVPGAVGDIADKTFTRG